jgi:hypothetical protein
LIFGACLDYGFYDLVVSRAATEMTREDLFHLFSRWMGIPFQKRLRRHQDSRSAKTALDRSVIDERLLQWMERFPTSEAFDRLDLSPFDLESQDQTGMNRRSIEQDRAGPALSDPAALLRSGQTQFLPEKPEQGPVGRHRHFNAYSI